MESSNIKSKKEKKKKQETNVIKEIKFRPKIDEHDYQFKLKNARQFLENGYKLKISLIFRGRELQFKEMGEEVFYRLLKDLEDLGETADKVLITGRINSLLLKPIKKK